MAALVEAPELQYLRQQEEPISLEGLRYFASLSRPERLSVLPPINNIDILERTRDGNNTHRSLSRGEMFAWVDRISHYQEEHEVDESQIGAWLGFVRMRERSSGTRMTLAETVDLTLAMAASGQMLDLSFLGRPIADKHSSGGVGDKVSLVVGPLVAACGVTFGKMSGRGLGHTGGTLDKMESIPGLTVDLSAERFIQQVTDTGIVIAGQNKELAPADGILYAFRNQTATIDCISLIAASIMSKKIASGANVIVLDVTTGAGAFMQKMEDAERLAMTMVAIGESLGIKLIAEISDMNQPRGLAVGNALEVKEVINTLRGQGPKDFTEHCIATAAHIVHMAKPEMSLEDAEELVRSKIDFGEGLDKFRKMVEAQGGDGNVVADPDNVLPKAKYIHPVIAPRDGYIYSFDPVAVGKTVVGLGGGREHKGDKINHAVGIVLQDGMKIGRYVRKGDVIMEMHSDLEDQEKVDEVRGRLSGAVVIEDRPPFDPHDHSILRIITPRDVYLD